MEPVELLLLTLLGGVVALDGASVAQIMISRPLVSGGLAGLALHDPLLGLAVGVVIELYLLPVFPVGGGHFPEGGPATVAGVGAALQAGGGAPGLAIGVLVGLAGARIGGFTVGLLRKVNGRIVPDPARGRVTPIRVTASHLSAIFLDFLRGSVLVASVLGLAVVLGGWAGEAWPLSGEATEGLLLAGAAVSLGALFRTLGGWRRRRILFLAGLVVGLTAVGLLP